MGLVVTQVNPHWPFKKRKLHLTRNWWWCASPGSLYSWHCHDWLISTVQECNSNRVFCARVAESKAKKRSRFFPGQNPPATYPNPSWLTWNQWLHIEFSSHCLEKSCPFSVKYCKFTGLLVLAQNIVLLHALDLCWLASASVSRASWNAPTTAWYVSTETSYPLWHQIGALCGIDDAVWLLLMLYVENAMYVLDRWSCWLLLQAVKGWVGELRKSSSFSCIMHLAVAVRWLNW